jgi:uncharacterized protein YbjT (DUF2867 family)
VAVGELQDAAFLTGALEGAEGFFTLLPPNLRATGVLAAQRQQVDAMAAAVKASRVPHVVLLSSVGADVASGNGPIQMLHHLENALRATGTQVTAVRAGSFQENVYNALGAAKGAGIYPNMSPSADAPFPMIATRDIGRVAAHELMFPSPKSDVLDLIGPPYSIRQVAEKLGAKLGKSLKVVDVPPQAQVEAMVQAGLSAEMGGLLAEMNAAFASGKLRPVGDRMKVGRTPIDAVIAEIA